MREQEAARLLALADAVDEGGPQGSPQGGPPGPLSPMGSEANIMHSARGALMSDTASLSNAETPRGVLHGVRILLWQQEPQLH